jgi:predicted RNA-binding Zn-ribbon protein involved in translation (DUF1610 family)
MLGVMDGPVAGRDYPRTLREFNAWFPDEAACLEYLVRLRWPGGFACPVCGGSRFWRMSKGRNLRCADCRVDVSLTAGTIFADTRLPLATWFQAAWYATGTKHGVSTTACEMVAAQVPLQQIGQVLRHRSLQSTAIYARVDLDQLRLLAAPWPQGGTER